MDVADALIASMSNLPLLVVEQLSGDEVVVSLPVQQAALKELKTRKTQSAGTDTGDKRATTA